MYIKSILAWLLPVAILISCDNGKQDKRPGTVKEEMATAPSGADGMLTEWLKGKMLVSEDPAKDYNNFKLFADGTCEDKGNARAKWIVENEHLVIQSIVNMKLKIEKKDEQNIILHRSMSDEVYRLESLD